MKVLVVTDASSMWGAEQRILDTARRIREVGIELTLAAPSGSPAAQEWLAADLSVVPFDAVNRAGLRRLGTDRRPGPVALAAEAGVTVRNSRQLVRLGRGMDVLHSHSLRTNLEVAVAARVLGAKAVLDVHDLVRPGLGRQVLTFGASVAHATIANSSATAATIGRLAQPRVTVIRPGVDTDRFHPAPRDCEVRRRLSAFDQEPIVGIVGRVDPEKGIDRLVRAVYRLNRAGTLLTLAVVGASTAGHGNWAERLWAEASGLLGERVRFLGAVRDVPEVIRNLDVLVNASDAEPFGRSLLEAQASRVPVVATRAGGIIDFVEDGRTGLVVPPGDEAGLAAALERLLADSDLRGRLAESAWQQAVERFSAQAHAEAVAQVYRRVTGTAR